MKNFIFILSFSLMVIALQNCKDEPPDPCKNYKTVSAEFEVFSILNEGWTEYEKKFVLDTFGLNSTPTFSAINKGYESYEWIFGTDLKHRFGAKVNLDFQLQHEERIKVTLITSGISNTKCNPSDDGKDTFSKYIYFREGKESSIFGRYMGYITGSPNNIFEIAIKPGEPGSSFYRPERVVGLAIPQNNPPKFFNDTATETGVGCNHAVFIISGTNSGPVGWAILNQKTNEIKIEYKLMDPFPDWKNRTFIGKKIK